MDPYRVELTEQMAVPRFTISIVRGTSRERAWTGNDIAIARENLERVAKRESLPAVDRTEPTLRRVIRPRAPLMFRLDRIADSSLPSHANDPHALDAIRAAQAKRDRKREKK